MLQSINFQSLYFLLDYIILLTKIALSTDENKSNKIFKSS